MSELEPILRLHLTSGIGMVTYRKLLRRFGSTEAVLAAPADRLAEVPGIGAQTAEKITESRDASSDKAAREMELANAAGAQIVPFGGPAYPVALRNVYNPPLVLYVRGDVAVRDTAAVAIVGARRCTHYGRKQARRLSEGLAGAGFTIISGLAYGIDESGHEGALAAPDGRTLAVLGSGLSRIYPKEHEGLAERIAERGALVTEFPMETSPSRENFPKRNRIISGMALGVIVVEGTETSGSLITARFAAEQGKEVFAVPGDISRALTRGPHRLLREGAKLVETIDDVLEELGPMADDHIIEAERQARDAAGVAPVDEHPDDGTPARARALPARERAVFDQLSDEPALIDDLIHRSGLSPQEVSGTLMVLEIKRLARQIPGKRYVRA